MLEEEGVLLCCLKLLAPSALPPAATDENVGAKEASILLELMESTQLDGLVVEVATEAGAAASSEYLLYCDVLMLLITHNTGTCQSARPLTVILKSPSWHHRGMWAVSSCAPLSPRTKK